MFLEPEIIQLIWMPAGTIYAGSCVSRHLGSMIVVICSPFLGQERAIVGDYIEVLLTGFAYIAAFPLKLHCA